MAMARKEVRSALLLRTCLEILRDFGVRVPKREVHAEIVRRVDLTEDELSTGRDGVARWMTYLGFHTGVAASVGLVVKMDAHWSITEAGLAALDLYPSEDVLLLHAWRRYREIVAGRQRSQQRHDARLGSIAEALDRVPRGGWTAHDDLAALAGTTVDEVVEQLATGDALPTAYRVLTVEGEVPGPSMLHPSYRGTDLRARLTTEGVEFYGVRANPDQHVPAELLRDMHVPQSTHRRAWLVRSSMMDGLDPVSQWLDEGFISYPAAMLAPIEPDADAATVRRAVAAAYDHVSYSVRERLVADVDAFLRRMRPGDLVLTTMAGYGERGQPDAEYVHLAVVEGLAGFAEVKGQPALRRSVRWVSRNRPFHLADLPAPLPTLTAAHAGVVDLTAGLASVELLLERVEGVRPGALPAAPARAVLPSPPAGLAKELLYDEVWLSGVVDLLRQRHQLVLFGPPGTGKTYLAMRLAEQLADPHAVTLVQLHPAYTYADFVQGYRAEPTTDGSPRLRLHAGPLRRIADEAAEHPGRPYLLIMDEINRADLASVLGEAYLLLEYRDRPISLPNSEDSGFVLPHNLYLIGTMNTADPAAAPLDPGLRRRFAFVEMHPAAPPVAGLLRRWLGRRGFDQTAADLLDRLNGLLAPTGHAVGPSYLMREEVHERPDGMEMVWRHDILPLLAERHPDLDVTERYGLDTLRASVGEDPIRP
jgi:5-methylcytosine-specific restriction protein B